MWILCACTCARLLCALTTHIYNINKVFSVNSISQPSCCYSVDRFITIYPMTSASYFWGLWESKFILKIPIMSLAPSVFKHLILINGWWRQWQAGRDRRVASDQSYSAMMQSECSRQQLIMIFDNGHFRGERGRCEFSRCSSYHHGGMTSHIHSSRKVQGSKWCRL